MSSGLREINGVNVLALDGFWDSIRNVSHEKKLGQALEYAGCEFHDDSQRFVSKGSVALVGVGGLPIASALDKDADISERLAGMIVRTREMMGSSAAFSYLNSGEKDIPALYDSVMRLGHFSVAHTVQLNFIIAGITEATELELSLQRDVVHLSKLTNTRTRIQNQPPIVVQDAGTLPQISEFYEQASRLAESLRTTVSGDILEYANGFYPVNKATVLMLSADLSNLRKLTKIRDDKGKEKEFRDLSNTLYEQLALLWPEILKEKEI